MMSLTKDVGMKMAGDFKSTNLDSQHGFISNILQLSEKLNVYLFVDGGSRFSLYALAKASRFSKNGNSYAKCSTLNQEQQRPSLQSILLCRMDNFFRNGWLLRRTRVSVSRFLGSSDRLAIAIEAPISAINQQTPSLSAFVKLLMMVVQSSDSMLSKIEIWKLCLDLKFKALEELILKIVLPAYSTSGAFSISRFGCEMIHMAFRIRGVIEADRVTSCSKKSEGLEQSGSFEF
ncbi:hypothetical protein TIFTF001_028265 [Ficus carica]|uniref:Uncharacterized protein n=1 Tax=Ficus carica TaxID=3494 RepID=A0AA88DPG6_FICCA|nr:hypothetical protein TIFTF001_028265 [Ficus carica]